MFLFWTIHAPVATNSAADDDAMNDADSIIRHIDKQFALIF